MAVMPMKRMTIVALRSDRKPILEFLQRQGQAEIDKNVPDDGIYHKIDVSPQKAMFEKKVAQADSALEILDRYAPVKTSLLSSLNGRTIVSADSYEEAAKERDEVMGIVSRILNLEKKHAESVAEIPKLEISKEQLHSWQSFDLPLDFKGTRKTRAFIGTLPGQMSLEDIYLALGTLYDGSDRVDVNVISSEVTQTCVMIVCGISDADDVSEVLHKMNFAKAPSISLGPDSSYSSESADKPKNLTPAQTVERIDAEIARCIAAQKQLADEITGLSEKRDQIRLVRDYFRMRADKYEIIGDINQSKHVFILTGYVTAEYAPKLESYLNDRYDLITEFEDPQDDEDVPVVLKNNFYASPVEGVISSYSMPGKGEIDPSFIVSLSYYIFFGLMLSDAAYGIIIALATGICLLKFKNMEEGLKKTFKMFFFCGIWTIVAGFVFGSFFGDVVSSVAQTFFHMPEEQADALLPALWFNPLDEPIRMLAFCFLLGLIHLFVGLGCLMYTDFKNHKPLDAIYDGLSWMMFVGGCVGLLLSLPMITGMLGLSFTLGATAKRISIIVLLIGVVIITLFAGRDSKNWGARIASGLYGVYGITGYLSDVLSYSRLLALGLATSVISSVFNTMAGMVGGAIPYIGVLFYILIFIIGHLINMAINALGAYVHSNRLEYVEFFGKFYNGGGRPLEPFNEKTKYYRIKEDI